MMEFVRRGGGEKVVGLRGWKMRVDRGGLCGGGAKERRTNGFKLVRSIYIIYGKDVR